jgi:two-component system, NtrC family, sensor kinase
MLLGHFDSVRRIDTLSPRGPSRTPSAVARSGLIRDTGHPGRYCGALSDRAPGFLMKLIPKLTLALVGGICVILAINGYLRVLRERRYFEADRLRDHDLIGRALGAAAAAVWKSDGEQAAVRAIDAVNRHFATVQIRWVSPNESTLPIDSQTLGATPGGQPFTRIVRDGSGGSRWNTYVPLDVDGARRGVIELSEPMTSEQRFVRSVIAETIAMTLALAGVSAALSFVMSQWFVGTAVRALSEKARRVGRGDFSAPVILRQRDELAELAREMNAMCDRLVATMGQLRHADRLATVGTLASGVAHELGTPLNVVAARAAMISSGEPTSEEAKDYARVIIGASDRMTKTIRRLLQFARREGTQRAQRDMHELVKEWLELLRPLADKRTVRLEIAPSDGDMTANVDAGQIQQVITNLVMNAIQATPRGGVVQLSLQRGHGLPPPDVGGQETEYLCLRVQDDGEGIASEHLPHIFEPFFTTKDVGEGTGLGLAVTYGIIREHEGWITVESTVNEGTIFSVCLPVAGVQ